MANKAFDPSNNSITAIQYAVAASGQQLFIPTTGYGDNANSGTEAQRLAQCQIMSPLAEAVVAE